MKKILLFVCLAFACQIVLAQDDDDEKKRKWKTCSVFPLAPVTTTSLVKMKTMIHCGGSREDFMLALFKPKTPAEHTSAFFPPGR
jgi:hypothetical protein